MKVGYLYNIQPACSAFSDNYFCTKTHICLSAQFICIILFTFAAFFVAGKVVWGTGANPSCHRTSCQFITSHINKQPFTLAFTPTVQVNS